MAGFRKIGVGWRKKAFAFNVLDRIPFGDQLYVALQHRVTHTLPRQLAPTITTGQTQLAHLPRLRSHRAITPDTTLLELGGGWDLYSNLLFYCMGVDHQTVVDIRRWANATAINAVIGHLRRDPPAGYVRLPMHSISAESIEEDLARFYGITYRAPFDSTRMDFADDSFDAIVTTSVFEHVPAATLEVILVECRRTIKPGGIMSHTVDYSDHYAHADASINEYNYLRFGRKRWSFYNPSIHHQNRLRTRDFTGMLERAGFDVVGVTEWRGSEENLRTTPLDPWFEQYGTDELCVLGGHFVATPR